MPNQSSTLVSNLPVTNTDLALCAMLPHCMNLESPKTNLRTFVNSPISVFSPSCKATPGFVIKLCVIEVDNIALVIVLDSVVNDVCQRRALIIHSLAKLCSYFQVFECMFVLCLLF